MHRRLAVILAADMVGYSRLMAADEADTFERLKRLRHDHLEPEIAKHGGEIVKLTGDGLLAMFGSAVSAVEAAVASQTAITTAESGTSPERRISFRIGLHIGDVILDENDIYGDGVNIAARMEAQADPGGVLLTEDVYRQVRNRTKLPLNYVGELALKNIPEPIHAYRIDIDGQGDDLSDVRVHSASDKPSIAILPFENMSTETEQDYFCDGVSEDIITELSRFPELFVIARNSSFSYKGKQVTHRDIGRELGVRYMLEGSLRRAPNRVRITAQLIECSSGRHVWAERYDRNLEDIFELQDEITGSVVGAIAPQISIAELQRASRARDTKFSSYDLALKAQAIFQEGAFSDVKGQETVIATAESALKLDPRNTHAHWIKAFSYAMRYLYQFDDNPDETLNLAQEAADKLFQRDRSDPRAYMVRGMIKHFRRAYDEATADFQRAFELNPNFALNIFLMAWHESLVGRTADAKAHAKLALRLSPRDADIWVGDAYLALAQAHFADNDFEKARHWGELAIQLTPNAPIRRALLIACAAHLGQPEDARPHAEVLASFAPTFLDSLVSGRLALYRWPATNELLVEGIRNSGMYA